MRANLSTAADGYLEASKFPREGAGLLSSLVATDGLIELGETVTLDDGRVVNGMDYLSAPLPGKKLVIFGDTAPCSAALALAKNADLIVHEATLEAAMEEKANSRGHSSTHQAAQLARDASAGKLLITHQPVVPCVANLQPQGVVPGRFAALRLR